MSDVVPAAPAAPAPAPAPTDIIGRLDAILGDPQAVARPGQQQQQQAPEQAEEPEVPAGPNAQVEGAEAAPEQGEPAPDTTQATPTEIALDELEAIELEVVTKGEDGKDVAEKLSVKALRDGYMKDADYRRKTADLARQREQLTAETRKGVEAERMQYLTELQKMHDLVVQTAAPELNGVNWSDLSRTDPFKYVELDNRKKEITHALEAIQSKQREVIQKHQAEHKEAMQKAAASAWTQLESDIPGFNQATYQTLMKAGVEKFGFKPDEVTNWVDPRLFKLLHAAESGIKAKEQTRTETPAPAKRVVVAPRVVKPGAPPAPAAQQRHAAAVKQLQGSGRIADAAEVIQQRFGG